MVGTTGFEPATSRTPSERATRLRYVPKIQFLSISETLGDCPNETAFTECGHETSSVFREAPIAEWQATLEHGVG